MDTETLARFTELAEEERALKARMADVKQEKERLEEQLLNQFVDAGVQNTKINGMTVYVHRQVWANHNGDKQALINALKNAGLEELVSENYSTQTLSAWYRELESLDQPVPDAVAPHLSTAEKFSLRTRRS